MDAVNIHILVCRRRLQALKKHDQSSHCLPQPLLGTPSQQKILSLRLFGIPSPKYASDRELYSYGNECRGLLYFDNEKLESFICNPTTNEFKFLPPSHTPAATQSNNSLFGCGFGYDYTSEDFKIVRTVMGAAEVYSLKTNCWKEIACPGQETLLFQARSSGKYINGNCYWSVRFNCGIVISFDFVTETFSAFPLPLPANPFRKPHLIHEFAELDNKLVVFVYEEPLPPKRRLDFYRRRFGCESSLAHRFEDIVEIFVREEGSWVKLFHVALGDHNDVVRPLGLKHNLLFLEGKFSDEMSQLLVFDLATQKLEQLDVYDIRENMKIFSYVESAYTLPDAKAMDGMDDMNSLVQRPHCRDKPYYLPRLLSGGGGSSEKHETLSFDLATEKLEQQGKEKKRNKRKKKKKLEQHAKPIDGVDAVNIVVQRLQDRDSPSLSFHRLSVDSSGKHETSNLTFFGTGCPKQFYRVHNFGCECHGLLYFDGFEGESVICNPTTKKLKFLPPSQTEIRPKSFDDAVFWGSGFGYDHTCGDFKVLRVFFEPYHSRPFGELYSLKKNCWKVINLPGRDFSNCIRGDGKYFKGNCYWVETHDYGIGVSFNFVSKAFSSFSLPLPADHISAAIYEHDFTELHNKLADLVYTKPAEDKIDMTVHIFVREEESWLKFLSVALDGLYIARPVGLENGVLFLEEKVDDESNRLLSYDLDTEKVEVVEGYKHTINISILSYIESTYDIPDAMTRLLT